MRGLIMILWLMACGPVTAADIEVFTLTAIDPLPTTAHTVTVYHLSGGDQQLALANTGMARDGLTTEAAARDYFTPDLQTALINQVSGLIKAASYDLRYFPAIVIDGKTVIYGVTDLAVIQTLLDGNLDAVTQ